MSTHHRSRLPLVLATVLATLALLAPAAVADDGEPTAGGLPGQTTSDAEATSEGAFMQQLREQVDSWARLLQERLDRVASAGVDGKAAALPDGPGTGSAPASSAALPGAACEDGRAGPYPCENVDLLSVVPNAELGGVNGNDLWGWTDPETGSEYAIMGTGYGTAFIDVTEPTDPVVVAKVVTEAGDYIPLWRDVKVHDDHAFIVSEHRSHGMQVVDLTRLRDLEGPLPEVLDPDAVYSEFGNAHNLAVNEDTGYAYAVGTDTCKGGLHMIDISKPTAPDNVGCWDDSASDPEGDGYTHDVQCVVYEGPTTDLQGQEVCFASNENTVTIVDVTDKANPDQLSITGYDSSAYTHQGWLTPDHEWFVFGDELDEQGGTVDGTTTYIMDVSDLTAPGDIEPYVHETAAIDHNLYIDDDYVWQANYVAGLRVLDYSGDLGEGDLDRAHLDEVASFEVVPEADPSEFAGAWSVYPFFESGTIIVSTLEQGLFILEATVDRPALDADDGEDGDDEAPGNGNGQGPPEEQPGQGDDRSDERGSGNGDPRRPEGGRPGGAAAWD